MIRISVYICLEIKYNIIFLFHIPPKVLQAITLKPLFFFLGGYLHFQIWQMFFLTKHIAQNRIDINDNLILRMIYIEFRQYLLIIDLNILNQNSANIGTKL